MDGRRAKSLSSLGFVTVVESSQHGLFGGYLVLAPSGRPLEFHCTEPVKPSRAQEILYGPTLESYLYGEQLGQALLGSSKKSPPVVLTDTPPMLAVRDFATVPIILVKSKDGEAKIEAIGDSSAQAIVNQLESLSAQLDLAEPFERIREAIGEAQRGSQKRAAA